jgi:hypothetical protein
VFDDLQLYAGISNPLSALFGSTCAAPPSLLALIDTASSSAVGSPSGTATASASALGNVLIATQASSGVELSASIPLNSPASSIELTIPYTTTGVTNNASVGCGFGAPDTCGAGALVLVDPNGGTINCADGSRPSVAPFGETGSIVVFPIGESVPAGSGTVTGIKFFCPDGSDLLPSPGFGFTVSVLTSVYSNSSQSATASANITLQDVTATIDS